MQSTYIRYERRGDKVTPVRVTKSWVSREVQNVDTRRAPKVVRKFQATRVSQVPWRQLTDREVPRDDAGKAIAWSSGKENVETRERILTLGNVRECCMPAPVLFIDDPAGWLPCFKHTDLDTQPGCP